MADPYRLQEKVSAGLEDKVSSFVRLMVSRVQGPLIRAMIQINHWVGPELRPVKEYSIKNLAALVEQSVNKLRENGFIVHQAATNRDAVDYILNLVRNCDVVKSKSNAVKEIGLIEALEGNGINVVETDLGDRICQMGNIPASHPIGPALHVPVQKVAELFTEETGQPVPAVPEEIVKVARKSLRQKFFQSKVGLSGANAIAADTGSIVLMENEGNIRSVSNLPDIHIIVAGIEKIVPTLEDGIKVVRAAGLFGMGLDFSTYVSVISGPSRTNAIEGRDMPGMQGPGEVHVVLLEEGRWQAIKEGFAESLYCINCGSCLGLCPIYSELGERYGYKYFGGIGVIHTAFNHGLEKALESGLSLCLGCEKCLASCPVSINTPAMIQRLRQKVVEQKGLDWSKKMILNYFLNHGSLVQKITPTALGMLCTSDGQGGWHLKYSLPGIEKGRRLPELNSASFLSRSSRTFGQGAGKVGYFCGCFNNVIFPRIADASLRLLQAGGARVVVPAGQKCCGKPALVNGDKSAAINYAIANLKAFSETGLEAIVTDCATCLSGLKKYPELLSEMPEWAEQAKAFAAKVVEIAQYLAEVGYQPDPAAVQCKVTYHQPCHLSSLGLTHGKELLKAVPGLKFSPAALEENCCGFGGTFNLDYYKLSKTIGSRKVEQILATGSEIVVTSCPGCMVQLMDVLASEGKKPSVLHISELLATGGGHVEQSV